jgi:hypothetical protein
LLALGDSITFGFDPNLPPADPTAFVSYADVVGKQEGLKVTNFAQPGETTASFLDMFAPNNGGWKPDPNHPGKMEHDRPLHASYDVDQADAAVDFLKQHPDTKLVTLTLEGNDLLLLQRHAGGGLFGKLKEAIGLPKVAWDIYRNVKAGLEKLRTVYKGPIVLADVYSTNYADRFQDIGVELADFAAGAAVAAVNRPGQPARVADVYGAFEAAVKADPQSHGNTGEAGLLLKYNGQWNEHPNAAGRNVIAQVVDAAYQSEK